MNCRFCGTELPVGALFCGECGRAVTAEQAQAAVQAGTPLPPSYVSSTPTTSLTPSSGASAMAASGAMAGAAPSLATILAEPGPAVSGPDADEDDDEELPAVASSGFSIADLAAGSGGDAETGAEAASGPQSCPQCGATVSPGDVFCGECGFVLRTAAPLAAEGADSEPEGAGSADATADAGGAFDAPGTGPATSIIVLPDLIRLGQFPAEPSAAIHEEPEPAPDTDAEPELDGDGPLDAEPAPESALEHATVSTDETTEVDPLPEPVAFGALDALAVESASRAGESDASIPDEDDDDDEPVDSADQAPDDQVPADEIPADEAPADQAATDQAADDDPAADETPIDELVHESPAQAAALAAAAAAAAQTDLEFDEPLPFALPTAKPTPTTTRARPIPDPFPWGTERPVREDIEATRLISDMGSGTRFVLQFSTGESVTVLGSGLVGRNPAMQPGEFVDQLVPIFDAGKSVSKTHLEFGQEGGRFWVSDRYSTNGSTIRQPDAEPRRADPGRRYFVARGTRVDLGEQFFVVS